MTQRALIDPRGLVCQVEPVGSDFPVAAPFKWVDCPDGTVAYEYTWDGAQVQPPAAPTLAEAQAAQSALVDKAYAAAIQQPVAYLGTTFQADTGSQTVLTQTVAGYTAAGAVPAGFWWLDANNNAVAMTLAQLQGLAAAMLAQGWTAFQHRVAQKKAIAAATSVATVQAITW